MPGFSNITSDESVIFADNASFDGTERGGALSADGELWIGSTTGRHVRKNTLIAGSGISISNGAGSITLSASGSVPLTFASDSGSASPAAGVITISGGAGVSTSASGSTVSIIGTGAGFTWVDATGATQALAASTGYVTNRGGGVAYTLPASGALGDVIQIIGKLGSWSVAQNANQQILIGSSSSTVGVGGSISSTNVGDCISLVCITAGASTIWRASNAVGNITIV